MKSVEQMWPRGTDYVGSELWSRLEDVYLDSGSKVVRDIDSLACSGDRDACMRLASKHTHILESTPKP